MIGRSVVMAEAGDPDAALVEIDLLALEKTERHQPWRVARERVATLVGRTAEAKGSFEKAIALTHDPAVRAYWKYEMWQAAMQASTL